MATFAVTMGQCAHVQQPSRLISTYSKLLTIKEIFFEIHPDLLKGSEVKCHSAVGNDTFEIDWATPLGDLLNLGVKTLSFTCKEATSEVAGEEDAEKTEVGAFQYLMG